LILKQSTTAQQLRQAKLKFAGVEPLLGQLNTTLKLIPVLLPSHLRLLRSSQRANLCS
jgi:hypothetical protein